MFDMVKPLQCANPFHQTTCHLSRKNIYARIFLFSSLRQGQKKKKSFINIKKNTFLVFFIFSFSFYFPIPSHPFFLSKTW